MLVLTAKADLADRLRSFDLGAVDFVTKPFWMEELVARLRARLRIAVEAPKRVVAWQDVSLDLDGRTVTVGWRRPVLFTRHEFDILAYLVERPSRAISRNQLAEHALMPDGQRDARTVDTHIARIRKKLGAQGGARVSRVGHRLPLRARRRGRLKIGEGSASASCSAAILCGLLGLVVSQLLIRRSARDAVLAGVVPYVRHTLESGELDRCAQGPERWSHHAAPRGSASTLTTRPRWRRRIPALLRSIAISTSGMKGGRAQPRALAASFGGAGRSHALARDRGGRVRPRAGDLAAASARRTALLFTF